MDQAERMMSLFRGNDRAHGTFLPSANKGEGKQKGNAKVLREETTLQHWLDHLEGEMGLGIIPIKDNDQCHWGAIDVDSYDVNHKKLITKLEKMGLKAVVCRSKSGGAHIYFFFTEEVSAEDLQEKLKAVAGAMGYAGSEIFPKQTHLLVDRGDTGNFLNMPYFGGEMTTRYGFNLEGESLTLDEFLGFAENRVVEPDTFFKVKLSPAKAQELLPEGPPCLQHLCAQGFGEGGRNNALFNLGVYARLSDPDHWEQLIVKYNMDYMKPPLGHNEVSTIIKQLQKKEYFYKCDDQPIASFCNKSLCLSRKFGVGPGQSNNDLSSLIKINGDPPIWILNVDGKRVELSTEALVTQTQFQKECVGQINRFPITVNARAWQTRMQMLLDNVTVVEVPPDATLRGEFEELLAAFCCDRAKGETREDILQGIAVWTEGRVWFQIKDVKKHLEVNKFNAYSSNRITLRLTDLGAEKMYWRIRNKGVHVWSLPEEFFVSEGPSSEQIELPELKQGSDVI
jgi:hypothetical protein